MIVRILTLILALGLLSCKSKEIKDAVDATNLDVPAGVTLPTVLKLTGAGINYQPYFSPDGKRFAYVSSDRPNHDNPQVYIMSLPEKEEKRITFQDGKTAYPIFSPDGRRLIYASTTDEAKEDTNFIKDSLERLSGQAEEKVPVTSFWQQQPFEVYSSLLNGSRIERLTKSTSYDAEVSIDPKDKRMIFISARDNSLNLHLASTTGTYMKALTRTKSVKSHPRFSPDGLQVVWVEYTEGMTSSDLYVADGSIKNARKLTDGKGIHFHPTWSNDNKTILFSSNRDSNDNYELYAIKNDGSCLQRLTWHSSNDTEPAFSPDGKSYLFTSDRSGEKQIYLSDFIPSKTCP